jgi:hypothetical protein
VADIVIRLHYRAANGKIEDAQQDYGLETFGGFLPAVGDQVLDPGAAAAGVDRTARQNRRMWTVVQRVFNPRDIENYVAQIVEEHTPTENEEALV